MFVKILEDLWVLAALCARALRARLFRLINTPNGSASPRPLQLHPPPPPQKKWNCPGFELGRPREGLPDKIMLHPRFELLTFAPLACFLPPMPIHEALYGGKILIEGKIREKSFRNNDGAP